MAGVYGLTPDGLARYRANRPQAGPGDVLAAIITDWLFGIPAIRVAEARAGHGTAGTWTYRFDHPDPDSSPAERLAGPPTTPLTAPQACSPSPPRSSIIPPATSAQPGT
jgi:hypothetical protein